MMSLASLATVAQSWSIHIKPLICHSVIHSKNNKTSLETEYKYRWNYCKESLITYKLACLICSNGTVFWRKGRYWHKSCSEVLLSSYPLPHSTTVALRIALCQYFGLISKILVVPKSIKSSASLFQCLADSIERFIVEQQTNIVEVF